MFDGNLPGRDRYGNYRLPMLESEWNSCDDAMAMLKFLGSKAGERQLRLLACACARSRWAGIVVEQYQDAVEIAERHADGLATTEDLCAAEEAVWTYGWVCVEGDPVAHQIAYAVVELFSGSAAEKAIEHAGVDAPAFIRDIFNPFRKSSFESSCGAAENGPLYEFARVIYNERRFEELPRLADLLVNHGCGDRSLLAHLRSSDPHVRGCWALDAVLGKGPGNDVVSETEWFEETHPFYMVTRWRYLWGEPSPRKCRLLAVASCRLAWADLTDERLRHAIELAELFADGHVSESELARTYEYALALSKAYGDELQRVTSASHEWNALVTRWRFASAAANAADPDGRHWGNTMHHCAKDGGSGRDTEDAAQAALVRDVLGNPCRRVIVNPSWLSWHGGAVVQAARSIYDQRAFHRAPLVADLLAEAGCTEPTLLDHLRGSASHVRGCWAIDGLLGLE